MGNTIRYSDMFTYSYKLKTLKELNGRDYTGTPETRIDELLIAWGNANIKPDPIKIYEHEFVPDSFDGNKWTYSKNRDNICIF